MIRSKKVVSSKIDKIIAVILSILLIMLFMSSNHASPRDKMYTEKVKQVNELIYDQVMASQEQFAEQQANQISSESGENDLTWQVAKTPRLALKSVMTNDSMSAKKINGFVTEFRAWAKANDYSPQDIKQAKVKLYVLNGKQRALYQKKLNQLRATYEDAVDSRLNESMQVPTLGDNISN